MMKIKGVIFDLDGTLANTLPLCIEAFRKSIEPLISRPVSDEEIINTFGPSEEGTILALAPDHYEEGVAAYLSNYERLHAMCPAPFEGIRELIRFLKRKEIRLALVTGKGLHSTEISLDFLELNGFFEIIETGSPDGPRKPEGIGYVLDFFEGLRKDEIIYVGDASSDITASRKAGIPVVAAAWAETAEPGKLSAMKPDHLFYTVSEFSVWIREMI